jgi:hypothetical protein
MGAFRLRFGCGLETKSGSFLTSRRMKACVQYKFFLRPESVSPLRERCDEDQVPAMCRDGTWDKDEFVAAHQILAKFLLPRTRDTRSEPIGSWNSRGFDDLDARGVVELRRGEGMRHRVESLEAL